MNPQGGGTQSNKRLIAFGGTGKTVALIYLKIARLLGEDPHIVVFDFPPSADVNSPDGRLDRDLRQEGLREEQRIDTRPSDWPAEQKPIRELLQLPKHVADAMLTEQQQLAPPSEGLNQQPQLGATVAHF